MISFRILGAWTLASVTTLATQAQSLELSWPTPSRAYWEGKPFTAFIQPTASGVPESGLYGCVRNGGSRFHEGIDIRPEKRDRRGEPTDPIYAILPGIVRHVSRQPGHSSYGRYVVIEHVDQQPAVYSMYAHLASIPADVRVGARVERGQEIAIMGRSASGYAIPRERAHLHLEIGLRLTDDFQSWYNWKEFGSRNEHGVWNGMNLLGVDPLDVYDQFRTGRVTNFQQYFRGLSVAVKLRVAARTIPDFVRRYPALLTKPLLSEAEIGGWEIGFDATGIPIAWTPLSVMETLSLRGSEVRVEEADEAALKSNRCRSLVFKKRGRYEIGSDLETVLQLLFQLRRPL
jgi:Membrane proteins related to metalloendopeptidases